MVGEEGQLRGRPVYWVSMRAVHQFMRDYKTVSELAGHLGTSPKAVSERLKALGVPIFGTMQIAPGVVREGLIALWADGSFFGDGVFELTSTMMKQKYADVILYLDFDGVLHDSEVYVSRRRGIELRTPERELFEWMPTLEEIMEPYPDVAIVLSTSWVGARCFDFAKEQLSPALQRRVIGATYHRREMSKHVFLYKPRWKQILGDVNRRKPQSWLALDDDVEGWPEELLPHLIATQGSEGVSASYVQQELVGWLRSML